DGHVEVTFPTCGGTTAGTGANGAQFVDVPAPSATTAYCLKIVNQCGDGPGTMETVTVNVVPTISSFTASPSSYCGGSAPATVRFSTASTVPPDTHLVVR